MNKIIIILTVIILIFIAIFYIRSHPLADVLGKKVEMEIIDEANDPFHFELKIYQLSKKTVSDFLKNQNKIIKSKCGYYKQNWVNYDIKWLSEEYIQYIYVVSDKGNTNEIVEKMMKLKKSNNHYYAMYYGEDDSDNMKLYIMDEQNAILYYLFRYKQ